MAHSTISIDAPPETVYGVLADPTLYALWVVGNKSIRGYDRSWPAPGSEFHHSVGFGPFATKDKTVVVASDPSRQLVLVVRALPFLRSKVSFNLDPADPGTLVSMEEQPT